MNVYVWLYILGACGVLSLGLFLYSLSRDNVLVKKLKLKKKKILVNWLLLVISILCFSMMIYLFIYIQNVLNLFEIN